MDATTGEARTTRQRAIDGLRAIAQLEEYVAAEIDEVSYFGELAAVLRDSAAGRRCAAARLEMPLPAPTHPRLRLVT